MGYRGLLLLNEFSSGSNDNDLFWYLLRTYIKLSFYTSTAKYHRLPAFVTRYARFGHHVFFLHSLLSAVILSAVTPFMLMSSLVHKKLNVIFFLITIQIII